MVFPPAQHLTSGLSQVSPAGSDISSTSPPSSSYSPRSSRQAILAPQPQHSTNPSLPDASSSYYSASTRGTEDRPSFDGSYTDGGFVSGSDEYSSTGTRSPPPEQTEGFANYQTYSSQSTPLPGSTQFGTGRFDYIDTFSSRANSPIPRVGSGVWDSLSPNPDHLISRLSGSRNRSRNPSGASTPVADKEAQYGSDCKYYRFESA